MKDTTNQHNGFVKIIVILVVLGLVFTVTGFNVRDGINSERIQKTATKFTQSAQNLYQTHAQSIVSEYIVEPAHFLNTHINTIIILPVKDVIRKIINTPKAASEVFDPPAKYPF